MATIPLDSQLGAKLGRVRRGAWTMLTTKDTLQIIGVLHGWTVAPIAKMEQSANNMTIKRDYFDAGRMYDRLEAQCVTTVPEAKDARRRREYVTWLSEFRQSSGTDWMGRS